jgi:aminopeptidase
MKDPRVEILAKNLLDHSVSLKMGERLLIDTHHPAGPLASALVTAAYAKGALPYVNVRIPEVERAIRMGLTEEHAKQQAAWDAPKMEEIDARITVIAQDNDSEMSDVPQESGISLTACIITSP